MNWKIIYRLAVIMLIGLPSFTTAVYAADVPKPAGHIYVQDFAQLLSADQKEELTNFGMQLDDATTAQLAVLTLPSIGDEPIEEFAVKALRAYKLGTKENNNGALLVVTTEKNSSGTRHFFLTTGYGLEGALPDGKIGRIIDEVAVPYLKEERPDLAITEAYKTFYNEIAAEYGWDGEAAPVTRSEQSGESTFGIPFPIVVFIIIYLLFRFFGNNGGRGGGSGGGRYRRRGGPIFFPGSFGGGGGSGFGGGGFRGGGGGSGGGGGAGRGW